MTDVPRSLAAVLGRSLIQIELSFCKNKSVPFAMKGTLLFEIFGGMGWPFFLCAFGLGR
jgi:hypothetical protein